MTPNLLPPSLTVPLALEHAARGSALFSPGSAARLCALAEALPAVAHAAGFEARLAGPPGECDISLWLTPETGGCEALARLGGAIALGPWQRLSSFAERWATPGSALHRNVAFLILEFDAAGFDGDVPIPSVFLALRPDGGWLARSERPESFPPTWLTDEALATLAGEALPARVRAGLQRTFDALPPGSIVLHVGAMIARRSEALRLFLSLPAHRVGEFLDAAGWEGDADRFQALAARHRPGDRFVEMQVDVGERVLPRVSLELPFEALPLDTEDAEDEPAESIRRVLGRLVEDRLCTREKANALLCWPENAMATPCEGAWPITLHKKLSHAKIALHPGGLAEAKGYFYYVPRQRLFRRDRPSPQVTLFP